MRCWKCGFEFGEGIFCPECGTKYEFEKVKIEKERLAKERAEERLANEKMEQERFLREKIQLEARTYNGIIYVDEQEARRANEENGKIDILKERLIPIKSQDERRRILFEFDSKETIQTVEAKKRYDLLKVKINQDKPKEILYNLFYGISIIFAIIITLVMGEMGCVENIFFILL